MSYINEEIDFTTGIFMVRDVRMLMIGPCQPGQWLPLGGHIELGISPAAVVPHA